MTDKELAIYIGYKIKEYRKIKGLTQKELAEIVEMGHTTIANYEKGFRTPKKNTLFKLANALNVTIDDFFPTTSTTSEADTTLSAITETVEQLTHSNQGRVLTFAQDLLTEQTEVSEDLVGYFTYNYYDQPASAGTGQYLNDINAETINLPIDIDADFVIPIKGDSMEPNYHDQDYIFIKLSVELTDSTVGVFQYDGEAYIKQLIIEDGKAWLHSFNPNYPNIPIEPEKDFRIIGEVVGRYGREWERKSWTTRI